MNAKTALSAAGVALAVGGASLFFVQRGAGASPHATPLPAAEAPAPIAPELQSVEAPVPAASGSARAPLPFGAACNADADCGSRACSKGKQGAFCSMRCAQDDQCPTPLTAGECNGRGFCKRSGGDHGGGQGGGGKHDSTAP